MNTNTRFMQSVISAMQSGKTDMPWARGTPRKTFIAKRCEQELDAKRSA